MNYLNQIPLARLTFPLIAGISYGLYFPLQELGNWFYLVAFFLLLALLFLSNRGSQYSQWFGITLTVFFMVLGVKLVEIHTLRNAPTYFAQYLCEDENYLVVKIDEVPQVKANSVKAFVNVEAVGVGQEWKPAEGRLLVYFGLDKNAEALKYGDKLLINASIDEVPTPLNPGQFDYKSYLERKGIYHRVYVKPVNYVITETGAGNSLWTWVYSIRQYLLTQFTQHGLEGSQLAVASALVLGYDDDIDNDLLQAYSASGTLHVLSVSGMHAGILFIVLTWLLGWMGQSLPARIGRAFVIILTVWTYALVTGFSSPVIRAAAMFSLFAIGKSLNRQANNYNILAGSCLLMLVLNPFLLADTGFQLSYLAVFGIAAMYPCLHRLWGIDERIQISEKNKPKPLKIAVRVVNWFTANGWSIIVMSIVAQLVTLPLGLYYFHQFPNYFILANLVVIPLSTIALLGGLGLLVFSWVPVLSNVLGYALSKVIWALNSLVLYGEQLPFSITDNIRLSQGEVLIMGFVIITMYVALKRGKKQWLFASLVAVLVFTGFRLATNNTLLQQQKLVVYNAGKASAIEVIAGNKSVLMADSLALPGTINYRFNLKSATWFYGISHRKVVAPSTTLFNCAGKVVLVINKGFTPEQFAGITKAEYVVVSGNTDVDLTLISKLKPEVVVFDASNKYSKVKEWQRELDRLTVKHYTVSQGAFVADL